MDYEKKRRSSVKINLKEYPTWMRGIIINKLYGNQSSLPENNYKDNVSIQKNDRSVFHVTPLINDK